jgi:hypothetical protein
VEADQVDFFAAAVFGDFQQVEHSEKSGLAGQFRGDAL